MRYLKHLLGIVLLSPGTFAQSRLPLPKVVVDVALKPQQVTIAALSKDGPVRLVAAIDDAHNNKADFVENELLLFTDDSVTAQDMASRWKGHVVTSVNFTKGRVQKVPSAYLIQITSGLATTLTLPEDLGSSNKMMKTGELRVSSQVGLLTLAAAARESAKGLQVGLNFVLQSDSIHDRSANEAADPFMGPDSIRYGNDPFHWPYMMSGGVQDIGVAEAWRALEAAGRFSNKVDVLIVDSGFDPNADFPSNTVLPTGTAGVPGPGSCGGRQCQFHGTDVTLAGFAVPDNDFGAAGPGGPVANLTLVSTPSADLFEILRFLDSLISSLIRGPRIINISAGVSIPAIVCLATCPEMDLIGAGLRALNILTIASAGNQGVDIDRQDCVGPVCWEAGATIPCEINGVICVGGLDWNSKMRKTDNGDRQASNFGSDSKDSSDRTTVRMFAPWAVWDLNRQNSPNIALTAGTSASAPFVAGVAALVMAANPNLSADDVDGILMTTAHSSPDLTVPRYVNAFEAVKFALGGSVPPTLTLISPLTSVQRPQDHRIEFEARGFSTDWQNISANVVWTSDLPSDNALPSGPYWIANDGAAPMFSLRPGTRHITASVTDHGWTDSSTVAVTVTTVPLTVAISSPSPSTNHFFTANSIVLVGESHYLEGRSLGDANVSWSDSTTGAALGTGHVLVISAATICSRPPCHHTLVFTGTTASQTATASVEIFIDPAPPGPPPRPFIDAPATNATFVGQFVGCTPVPPQAGVLPVPMFRAMVNLRGHAIDYLGVAIPDSGLTWSTSGAPVIGTGGSINGTIVATQLSPSPGQPILVQISLAALDTWRNAGSVSETINITTTPVTCP